MTERTDEFFHSWISAAHRFDYFVTGSTGALMAFIAKTYAPQRIDLSPSTLEPLALVLLLVSFIFGLKRIRHGVTAMRLSYQQSVFEAVQRTGDADKAKALVVGEGSAAAKAYEWRDRFLIWGLILFILAKVLAPY